MWHARGAPRPGIRCILLFILGVLLLPGTLFAFWPIEWDLDGQKNFLGPLVSYQKEEGETHLTLRPLLSSYDSPRTYTLLFPLGKSEEEKSYFVPLYVRHKSEDTYDVSLFTVFWGQTREKKSYGGVFPFYGRLYNRFKRDEIGFFLWPLYGYSKGEDTTRTNIVWPFFSIYSGRQEGFKIGPLYGQRRIGDERKSMFVLWPFFIKDEKGLDTDEPIRSVWAIPFYMQTKSAHMSFYAVLWPLFTYSQFHERTTINAPWPVFSHTTGGQEQGFSMWPLYSRYQKEKDETTYVLWPIYKEAEKHPADEKTWTEKRVLLLNNYTDDDRGRFLNVWPFFEYRSARPGAQTLFLPSIIPWRNAGYDRIVRPLLTLYEYRKTDDKTVSNLLYGFYTKEQKGESWKRRLAFLFEVGRQPEGMGFSVLSGLFAVDPARFKVFYIPIERSRAEDVSSPAPTPEETSAEPGASVDPCAETGGQECAAPATVPTQEE
jgi:hypothetical protein